MGYTLPNIPLTKDANTSFIEKIHKIKYVWQDPSNYHLDQTYSSLSKVKKMDSRDIFDGGNGSWDHNENKHRLKCNIYANHNREFFRWL